MSTLERAIQIASQAHAGQKRKNGMPYVLHPIRVMLGQQTLDAMIVAILHDVLEDTNVTINDLRNAGFTEPILSAVALLTHADGVPYEEYIQSILSNSLASAVKKADLEDNMNLRELPEFTEQDGQRSGKYHKAWRTICDG